MLRNKIYSAAQKNGTLFANQRLVPKKLYHFDTYSLVFHFLKYNQSPYAQHTARYVDLLPRFAKTAQYATDLPFISRLGVSSGDMKLVFQFKFSLVRWNCEYE